MQSIRSMKLVGTALVAAMALAACGKSAPPAPAPTPVQAPSVAAPAAPPAVMPAAAPAPATAAVEIKSVTLANALGANDQPTAPMTSFGPKDTIYGVVAFNSTNPSAPLTARWTYQGGQLVNEQPFAAKQQGANSVAFHIAKPDGFPAGNYSLEILSDGKSISITPFSVK